VHRLVGHNGAVRQLAHAGRDGDLRRVTAQLADAYFCAACEHAVPAVAG
jgi:hypothetical protein